MFGQARHDVCDMFEGHLDDLEALVKVFEISCHGLCGFLATRAT